MGEQDCQVSPRCSALFALGVVMSVALIFSIPLIIDLTQDAVKCGSNEALEAVQPNTNTANYSASSTNNDQNGEILGVSATNSSNYNVNSAPSMDYVPSGEAKNESTQERITSDKCLKLYVQAIFSWIGIVLLLVTWVVLSICIIYGYRVCREKNKLDYDDTPRHCFTLRSQYYNRKWSRIKYKFQDHKMLKELDPTDPFEKQITNYINKYLANAWAIRQQEYSLYDENEGNYKMNVRHVYRINNPRVWEYYEGDKSSLDDIVNNLSSIKLGNTRLPGSFVAPSVRTDISSLRLSTQCSVNTDNGSQHLNAHGEGEDTSNILEEVGSHLGTIEEIELQEIGSNPEGDQKEEQEEEDEGTNLDDENASLLQPDSTAVQAQANSTNEEENDNEEENGEENDDIVSYHAGTISSVASSQVSIPLLAHSWRISVRSSSIRPGDFSGPAVSENCMFLLHGTPIENVFGIIENGLDMSYARPCEFGRVMGLSESSWVADKYADSKHFKRDKNLVMFIMRTSLKHAYWRVNNEHVPPSITKNYSGLVSGTVKGYRQFRIFKEKCCYPEFVVLYDRVHPQWSFLPWAEPDV